MIRTALSAILVAASAAAHAAEPADGMIDFVNGQVAGIFSDPAVQDAVRAGNAAHAMLSEADILALDTKWRAEVGQATKQTIDPVLGSPASEMLRAKVAQSGGKITEIILMDNRGLNVAISDVTSDYWQGDEAKFLETFPKGATAVHVSDIEFDESSQSYQAQVSIVVVDSATGAPIGAATVGLNAETF